jgi:hypothetical protein
VRSKGVLTDICIRRTAEVGGREGPNVEFPPVEISQLCSQLTSLRGFPWAIVGVSRYKTGVLYGCSTYSTSRAHPIAGSR